MSDITYILFRSGKTYACLKNFFAVEYIMITNNLKICSKVKIPYYYGLRANTIIFDKLPLPDWVKEYDPSLSGKINNITVKNW